MIVLLTEEQSMREVLESLIARHFPQRVKGVDWLVLAFSGKSDLEKNIPIKMRGWSYGNPFFVNADTVNPYGTVAGATAGIPVTNPAVTPPAGAATTTPGAAGTDTVAPGGIAGTTLLNPLGTTTP